MRARFSGSVKTVAIAATAVSAVISVFVDRTSAQAPAGSATAAASAPALKTPWGEPDLQGIWTDETDTPLQRSPKYANQEFFTEAQRPELDRARAALLGRGSERSRDARDVVAPTIRSSCPSSAPARVVDCRSARWPDAAADARRRRLPLPGGNFVSPCC
jgi:hypothetical protein